MRVYKFYLGAHKSGKKEKYPLFNHLLHTISIMTNVHTKLQGVLLDLLTSHMSNIHELSRVVNYF